LADRQQLANLASSDAPVLGGVMDDGEIRAMADQSASARPCLFRTGFVLAIALCMFIAGAGSAIAAPAMVLSDKVEPPPPSVRFQKGVKAYDKGDYATAFKIWLPLAQHEDLAAMRNVALLLRTGKGVDRDPARALWFYEEAGSKGFALAQLNAAFMHLEGDGVPKNLEAAAFWFHAAARAGSPIAQYNLAVMYESGTGVEKDMGKALGWYALAARSGSEPAIKRLALLVPALDGPKAPERAPKSPKDESPATEKTAPAPSDQTVTASMPPPPQMEKPSASLPSGFREGGTDKPGGF
jgi:hypothetical protein